MEVPLIIGIRGPFIVIMLTTVMQNAESGLERVFMDFILYTRIQLPTCLIHFGRRIRNYV